jgi:riboflavin synthase
MFTGIIETLGIVEQIQHKEGNIDFTIASSISNELKVDQSIAHNGVCLTLVELGPGTHTVTAIAETLKKTNIGELQIGAKLNLERCMQLNGRLDGHIVQGHVDQVGKCTTIEDQQGSWLYTFSYDKDLGNVTIEKGSICINGVSLTVVNSQLGQFSVAIIPYTYEHTSFHQLQVGSNVNLEFDVIGKYVKRLLGK